MPACFTHHLVAEKAYLASSTAIRNVIRISLPLYFFGAQGADFCFFNPSFKPKSSNFGSFLHREGGYPSLQVLKTLSMRNCELFAYALGYVTHYAADSTFHPYVYAKTGNSPLRHTRLEHLLDIRFKKQAHLVPHEDLLRKKLDDRQKELLFLLYTTMAVKLHFPPPKKNPFYRSISLFNAYMPLPNALFDGASAKVRSIAANEENLAWSYPAAPHIVKRENADMLLAQSISIATEGIHAFFKATKDNQPLSKALFGKGFLTGV